LGNLVRTLNVSRIQSSYDPGEYKSDLRKCDSNQRSLLIAAIDGLDINDRLEPLDPEEWTYAIDNDLSELYFTLLLTKVPKLERLDFQTSHHSMKLLDEFVRIAMCSSDHIESAYLGALKSLTVNYAEDQVEESFELWEYRWLLSLPTLKEFRGVQICEEDDYEIRPDFRKVSLRSFARENVR
jgi:hypothetical protein